MDSLRSAIDDLVDANRILANENVVDGYGHVSVRHPFIPNQFLLSRSRSPELVEQADILEFNLDGEPVQSGATPYLERFIHGAIYEARPDVNAVIHSHADEVLPFTLTTMPLRPVIHTASDMGINVPLWDIRDEFGDTDLLVRNIRQGRDLAKCLGANNVVLMRGHGFAAAGRSLVEVVKIAVYLPRNAKIQLEAMRMGQVKELSQGEIDIRRQVKPDASPMKRAWEYWRFRAGRRNAGSVGNAPKPS